MNRATPADLLSAMTMAYEMTKAGVLFVPMPVSGRNEYGEMASKAVDRMAQMIKAAEAEEAGGAA